jgi:hypothetical protein
MLASATVITACERDRRLHGTVVAEPPDPRVRATRIVDHALDNRPSFRQHYLPWRVEWRLAECLWDGERSHDDSEGEPGFALH